MYLADFSSEVGSLVLNSKFESARVTKIIKQKSFQYCIMEFVRTGISCMFFYIPNDCLEQALLV